MWVVKKLAKHEGPTQIDLFAGSVKKSTFVVKMLKE